MHALSHIAKLKGLPFVPFYCPQTLHSASCEASKTQRIHGKINNEKVFQGSWQTEFLVGFKLGKRAGRNFDV